MDNEVKGVTHAQPWCGQHGGHRTGRALSSVEHCPLLLLWEMEPEGRGQRCSTYTYTSPETLSNMHLHSYTNICSVCVKHNNKNCASGVAQIVSSHRVQHPVGLSCDLSLSDLRFLGLSEKTLSLLKG